MFLLLSIYWSSCSNTNNNNNNINRNTKCDDGLLVLAQVEQKLVVNRSCMLTTDIKYVFGFAWNILYMMTLKGSISRIRKAQTGR